MDVQILAPAGEIRGYLAEPPPEVAGQPPWPGVVVVHDALGLNSDARSITDRIAQAGYLALVPDLYSRGGILRCVKSTFMDMRRGSGRSWDDLDAARRLLADRADCSGKVGIAGFCLGGGFALVGATREFDVSAPFYGELPDDSALEGACPVVASFGARDLTLRGAAAKLETTLTNLGVPHDVKEYPDAGHSFANRIAPGPINVLLRVPGFHYHHESAEDAWRRVFAFFDEHL